ESKRSKTGSSRPSPKGARGRLRRSAGLLPIEPHVFQAEIVDDAVGHHRPTLDPGLPAIGEAVVKNDWPGAVLSQLLLDLPDQLLAFVGIDLGRLLVEQLFQIRVAITGVVAR